MGKSIHDDVFDQALNYLKNNAENVYICSTQPTTFTEASSTYKLADVAVDSSDFTGPANGDTSGRKITLNQQTGVTVDSSGTAQHLAITDDSASKLLIVTDFTSQSVTAGNTLTINAFDLELRDPS